MAARNETGGWEWKGGDVSRFPSKPPDVILLTPFLPEIVLVLLSLWLLLLLLLFCLLFVARMWQLISAHLHALPEQDGNKGAHSSQPSQFLLMFYYCLCVVFLSLCL